MTMIDFGALRRSRARIAAENAEHQRRAAKRALWWARAALASDRAATSRRAARRLRDIYDRECLLPEIRQLANVMQRRADRLAARSMIYPQPRRVYPGLEEARS